VPNEFHVIQHIGAVQHAEIDDLMGKLEQFLKVGKRRLPQLALAADELTQLEQPDSQPEPGRAKFQQSTLDHFFADPVQGWFGNLSPGCQLCQAQFRFLPHAERVQDGKDTREHGDGN
jgi:hypothetical protein